MNFMPRSMKLLTLALTSVRKNLMLKLLDITRSLAERFIPKVTAIEENKDLDSVRVEELLGSIHT
jgi:hypothetical protein